MVEMGTKICVDIQHMLIMTTEIRNTLNIYDTLNKLWHTHKWNLRQPLKMVTFWNNFKRC